MPDDKPEKSLSENSSPQVLPYGSWPSPISAALVAGTSRRLGQPKVHRGAVFWTETRPEEKGRTTLVRWTAGDGSKDIVPAPYSVQSRVHEYGGGAFAAHDETCWFVNKQDQCIHVVKDGSMRKLTAESSRCFADLVHDLVRNRLLAISEDHAFPEPRTSLVAIDCTDGAITTLREGGDFYSSPRLSPDANKLAWLEWNHPDMPWDAAQLMIADVTPEGGIANMQAIAGGDESSVAQPVWRNNDEIMFAWDDSDWWNLYAWRDGNVRALHPLDAEFALPHWVFGMQSFGLRDANTVICAYTQNGTWRVAELDLETGNFKNVELPFTQIEHLHAADGGVVLQAASSQQAASIVLLDGSNKPQELRRAASFDLDAGFLPPPEAIAFKTGDDDIAHGLYYAPANPEFRGERETAPPLLVKVHGGPTAATSSALDMKLRFWTSRGFAVLDVNYRGSTGYGRNYREKLYGQWGIADVEDCVFGARELAKRGLADPERLLISGSSAGGFTVLAALTFHDVFAGGASYYGIGDLAGAMRDTAKFESRYGDKLVGPLPECEGEWRARSPLFHAEQLKRPVIFFQGLDDRIVPPDQSERMFDAARANGVATAYLPFPGEGHGFRQAETIEAALNAEYAFYCEVLGIPVTEESGGSASG
ncbi:MAG TPA: prolyl oligopeptidase family serine peptidase [Gammaproteobacteria bacterium]